MSVLLQITMATEEMTDRLSAPTVPRPPFSAIAPLSSRISTSRNSHLPATNSCRHWLKSPQTTSRNPLSLARPAQNPPLDTHHPTGHHLPPPHRSPSPTTTQIKHAQHHNNNTYNTQNPRTAHPLPFTKRAREEKRKKKRKNPPRLPNVPLVGTTTTHTLMDHSSKACDPTAATTTAGNASDG